MDSAESRWLFTAAEVMVDDGRLFVGRFKVGITPGFKVHFDS